MAKKLSTQQRATLREYFLERRLESRRDGAVLETYRHEDDERRILVFHDDEGNERILKRFRDGESTWNTSLRYAEDHMWEYDRTH